MSTWFSSGLISIPSDIPLLPEKLGGVGQHHVAPCKGLLMGGRNVGCQIFEMATCPIAILLKFLHRFLKADMSHVEIKMEVMLSLLSSFCYPFVFTILSAVVQGV